MGRAFIISEKGKKFFRVNRLLLRSNLVLVRAKAPWVSLKTAETELRRHICTVAIIICYYAPFSMVWYYVTFATAERYGDARSKISWYQVYSDY